VSAVSREAISEGRFSSKKRGGRVSKFFCTATRRSATVRSPIHETKKKRIAVAAASTTTIISRYWKAVPTASALVPLEPKPWSMTRLKP
jgi:hypothetical protein